MVSLGLPVLEAMLDAHGEAFADGSPPPVRFVVWFFGDGVASADIGDLEGRPLFAPAQTGPDYPLTSQLAGLADVRDYCSVLSGFDITAATPNLRPHHAGLAGFLTGHEYTGVPPDSAFGGPTIDHVIADRVGHETFLPSLQLSVTKRASTSAGPTVRYISAAGPMLPIESISSPSAAWDLLFGSFTAPDDPNTPARLARIDAVMDDLAALQRRLGAVDRLRLEAHMDGLVQLSQQIDALPPICRQPAAPVVDNVDEDFEEPLVEVNAVMSELVAYAFACDVTRVVSYRYSSTLGETILSPLGQTATRHLLTHMPGDDTQALVDEGAAFMVDQFAVMLQTLKDTPEGDANLLDNTCAVMGTDVGVGYHHTTKDMPCIVAGRGGGALAHPGVHYRSMSGESTSNIMLTCARTVAPEIESFGGGPGQSTGEVEAIMA